MKKVPSVAHVVLGVFVLITFISLGESLWWTRAKGSYPRVLMSEPPANTNNLVLLRQACGTPLEVVPTQTDMALVRCGTYWPFRSIWLVPRDIVAPAL